MGYVVIGSTVIHFTICLLILKKNNFVLTYTLKNYL